MKIKVNIYDHDFVPALGRGPFFDKVINEELYRSLRRLGYQVEEVNEAAGSAKLVLDATDPVAEEVPAEPVVESPAPEVQDTPVAEVQEQTPAAEPEVESPAPEAPAEPVAEDQPAPAEETQSAATEEAHADEVTNEDGDLVETEDEGEDVEEAPVVDAKEIFTEEEITFLKGKARSNEIKELLTSKGVEIPEDHDTIKEMLALVGLKR